MSSLEQHEHRVSCLSSASSKSTESIEENIRKILNVVDGKGRVLVDSNEMADAARQLAVEASDVHEFLAQIRYENNQKTTDKMASEQFNSTTRRSNSCPEDLAKQSGDKQKDNNENKGSDKGPVRETWDMDSGTHDLGNYEPALQQLMTAATNAKGQSRSSNFLELANTLHLAALASLKNEIVEVSGKLQQVTEERDSIKNSMGISDEERKELIRDYEERLLAQAQQSEEQITELQSVIAELNKKLANASANKIEELEEVESQTSEHGSRSSESLESLEDEDEVDDELSKVVGDLEFAIEREKPETKDNKKDKEPIKVTVKVTDDQSNNVLEVSKAVGSRATVDNKQQECNQYIEKARLLREQCVELEKKKQVLERQLQQASLREYVARKKSSSIGSEGVSQDAQTPCNECAGLRTKLNQTTQELEASRQEISGFREERDKLRKRILEMQEHLKALHQKTMNFETRSRSSSFNEPGSKSPRQLRANPPQPGDPRGPHTGSRSFPRQTSYSSAASDISSRDGFLASPRTARRASIENINNSMSKSRSPSTPRRSVTLPGNYGRRPSGGSMSGQDSPTMTPRGSVQSIASSQSFWRGAGTSDLGSSQGSSQEITVIARPVDDAMEARTSGDHCIRSLSQLPEFANGRLPNELLRSLRSCRNIQDVYKVLFSYCDDQADKKLKEYELEIERFNCTVEHLQSQINVLSLSLEESRDNAEKMCVLMGKYESNNTASQLSLSFCDKVIETYEVLLQLSESEQSCLIADSKAAGVKTSFGTNSSYRLLYPENSIKDDQSDDIEACLMRRRTAENEARSLLQKLDKDLEEQYIKEQPWESVSSRSRTSSGSSNENMEFTREEETRLKSYIQQLKSERLTVGSTVLELEGIHDIPEPQKIESPDPKLDLENAVLMQELMALKEEKAELKAKNYLIEKEKKALELKINSREAQEQAYLLQIEQLKSEIREELKKRRRMEKERDAGNKDGNLSSGNQSSSGSGSGNLSDIRISDDDLPTDLHEAAIREKKHRARIKELMEALESLSKNSETRHTQTAEYVSDLKRANGALVAAYEKAKKKHAARLRKLEQQMMSVVERHDAQVRTLKERIALLEEELSSRQNETAL